MTIPKRCQVMGVLNVTPDSFSDAGRYVDPAHAVAHAAAMIADGADLIDVGGESTRPGARRPDADEEARRVLPVLEALAGLVAGTGVQLSVDTMRADLARRAVQTGAHWVNDVSGGRADPAMHSVVAELGVPYILMHWRGPSESMHTRASYGDVVAEVVDELADQRDAALRAGIEATSIVLDPGIGFAKSADQNWALLSRLGSVGALGHRLLVGTSRKRFLGALLAEHAPSHGPDHGASQAWVDRDVAEREHATTATTALAASAGAWGVRVHDVRAAADAVRVVARWQRG